MYIISVKKKEEREVRDLQAQLEAAKAALRGPQQDRVALAESRSWRARSSATAVRSRDFVGAGRPTRSTTSFPGPTFVLVVR